jgi:hypothetical protein
MEEYVEKTKKGFPALWEGGGGMMNTGYARIVCSSDGSPKKPIFIKTGGHLALQDHALFIIQEGDVIIDVKRHHDDFNIIVKRIKNIKNDIDGHLIANIEIIAEFSNGEWDHEDIVEKYKNAIEAGKKKSEIYHCRSPIYYKE